MANRREIVKRRTAVRNIRKITRTMQLIATARYQTAYKRAAATKPYSEKLAEMVANLARASAGLEHPLMAEPQTTERSALVVITSSRGLCGGYNSNVLHRAVEHIDRQAADGVTTDTIMVRKKGINYFEFVEREMAEQLTDITDMPGFGEVEPLADRLMERFVAGEVGSVYVAYMHFYSTARQRPEVVQLLPLAWEAAAEEREGEGDEEGDAAAVREVEFEFSPAPQEILDELLPASVRMRLYQAFTEAAVSEQMARMVAMKQATDAAEKKIKQLTREYNRARQTAITMELLDIVGGASALA